MSKNMVRCPQCGARHEYRTDNPARPFCSARCKLIDLGAWAEGKYTIPGPPADPMAASDLQNDDDQSGHIPTRLKN